MELQIDELVGLEVLVDTVLQVLGKLLLVLLQVDALLLVGNVPKPQTMRSIMCNCVTKRCRVRRELEILDDELVLLQVDALRMMNSFSRSSAQSCGKRCQASTGKHCMHDQVANDAKRLQESIACTISLPFRPVPS